MPGRVGMIGGIFFGFAFGMGGIAAAVLGIVADMKGIDYRLPDLFLFAVARLADRIPAEPEAPGRGQDRDPLSRAAAQGRRAQDESLKRGAVSGGSPRVSGHFGSFAETLRLARPPAFRYRAATRVDTLGGNAAEGCLAA